MELDELIKALERIRDEHGGELSVFYFGLNSPVNGAIVYNSSIGEVVTLT